MMAENTELDSHEVGDISVSNDVFETIAATCTKKVAGVAGIESAEGLVDSLSKVWGRSDSPKGVKVTTNENELSIDLTIMIGEGFSIPQVTDHIQREVKSVIEDMTGHSVSAVNILVADVQPIDMEASVVDSSDHDRD